MKRQSADSLAAKRIQTGFPRAIYERTRLSLLIILIPRFVAPGANPGKLLSGGAFQPDAAYVDSRCGSATGPATARGGLRWIRFRATLWVPERWRTPEEIKGNHAKCAE
jgi:hypothetical protein